MVKFYFQIKGNITHYQCGCSESTSISRPITTEPNPQSNYIYVKCQECFEIYILYLAIKCLSLNFTDPPLIDIPKNKGKINNMLVNSQELKNHPGLMAALQSLRNKRSSKNAYILLLGMTGSGKSSAVSILKRKLVRFSI